MMIMSFMLPTRRQDAGGFPADPMRDHKVQWIMVGNGKPCLHHYHTGKECHTGHRPILSPIHAYGYE